MRYAVIYFWLVILALSWVKLVYDWLRGRVAQHRTRLLAKSWAAGLDLMQRQQWPEALAALDQALALLEVDPSLEADLHFHRGYTLEQMQQLEGAISAYVACQHVEAARRTPKYRHLAAFRQGYLLTRLQRWVEAELSLRTSVKEASRIPQPDLQLNALRILLGAYQAMHRHTEALECAQEALRLARDLRDESMEALVMDIGGDLCLSLERSQEALHYYEQSLDLFRKLGDADAERVVRQDIGKLYQACGEWDRAFCWLGVCLQEEERAQNRAAQARIAYDIACLHIHSGELDKAAGYLQRSMGLFRQADDRTGADLVGRTLVGFGILMHRRATANWLTFADIERGSAKLKDEKEE